MFWLRHSEQAYFQAGWDDRERQPSPHTKPWTRCGNFSCHLFVLSGCIYGDMLRIENMSTVAKSDAELVAASLGGDRNAFGQIVNRYQTLVCSLAYSGTGSLTQSEDLAQEAFLRAWKELPRLREPSKVRPWLCSIVRYLISKARRRDEHEPLHRAEPLEAAPESRALEPSPPDRTITKEEETILWRSLDRIPETYREPLVLFYREHQSVANVATALDLSEDAVKQRLSRGRKLLHEEVLGFVEGTLERTSPGQSFAVGVLAAIPFLAPSTEAATVGAATVAGQGSGTVKGAGILGIVGYAGLGLAAVTGQIAAIWGWIQGGRSARERKFLARTSWGALAWKVLVLATILVVASFSGNAVVINSLGDAGRWVIVWLVLLALWVFYSIWVERKRSQIQLEQDLSPTIDDGTRGELRTRQGLAARAYGGLGAWIFGPGGLLILLVHQQGNQLVSGALLILAISAWLVGARAIMQRPESIRRVFISVRWGLALVTLITLNLLWHFWVSNPEELGPENPQDFPTALLILNLLVIVFYGSLELASWLVWRFAKTPKRCD